MDERKLQAEDLILDMKDTSELMVDLAYSAVMFQSMSIAKEVEEMEEEMGEMLHTLNRLILELVRDQELGIDQSLVILRIAQTAESIANAALEIADVVLRDVELHPILREAIHQSESTILMAQVGPTSEFVNRSLRESELETETGMRVLACKRGTRWNRDVDGDFVPIEKDTLICSGPWDARESFLARMGSPDEDEDEESFQ